MTTHVRSINISNRLRLKISGSWTKKGGYSSGTVALYPTPGKPEIYSFSQSRRIGKYTSSQETIVLTYNLPSGAFMSELKGDFIDFSLNKDFFLVSNGNKSQLYEPSGKALVEFVGGHAVFIPDQERLFTTLDYGATRLYDFSGNVLAEFPGRYLMMSPDGRFLITNLRNGKRRLWRIDSGIDDLLARGCNWLQPYLKFHPEDLKRLKVCQINK